jgi:hypothetical protein
MERLRINATYTIPKQLQNLGLDEREGFRNSSIVSDLILKI